MSIKPLRKKLPSEGVEPSIPYGQRILSASRIPVPTQGQAELFILALVFRA